MPKVIGDSPRRLSPRRNFRRVVGGALYILFLSSVCVGILGLSVLVFEVVTNGLPWLNWQFITDYPSRHPDEAGLFSALMGTIWLMVLTALFTVPVGVGAAIYTGARLLGKQLKKAPKEFDEAALSGEAALDAMKMSTVKLNSAAQELSNTIKRSIPDAIDSRRRIFYYLRRF